MVKDKRIFIVGDRSIIGNALIQYFRSKGFINILSESVCGLDLIEQSSVYRFFKKEKPEYVFLTYVKSGGVGANMKYPGEFIYNNLQIQNNVIHYAHQFGTKRLCFLGSSCIYPRNCPQPIKEEYLLSGKLEEISEPYAISKIAGIKMCQAYNRQYGSNYVSIIPATIYGPGDNFDLNESHVIPSLIRKFHGAKMNNEKEVIAWGTGKPRREFIYIDDLVEACLLLIGNYNSPDVINIGYGSDISIKELVLTVRSIVGFKGKITFDGSKPDGVLRKLLDSSKMKNMGWQAKVSLEKGIKKTYEWFSGSKVIL